MGHEDRGQLTLEVLYGLGQATVRALEWCTAVTGAESNAISEFFQQVVEAGGDAYADDVSPPENLVVQQLSFSPDIGSWWEFNLWSQAEWDASEKDVVWCWTLGIHHRPFAEIPLFKRLGSYPFWVVVESDSRDRTNELTSMTELVKWARGQRGLFPDMRKTAQELDALSKYVTVTIDPAWKEKYIADSVVAQVVDCFIRVDGSPYARLPLMTPDCYEWWGRWAQRAMPSRDKISFSDLFEVARRSVRPPTAAAHRLYWRKSLQVNSDEQLLRAAAKAGISRRTAYERLKKHGRHLRDFAAEKDPESSLAQFLVSHAPASRLSESRRTLISALRESGMTLEAARKLERRIRYLQPRDQESRVRSAIKRAQANRHG